MTQSAECGAMHNLYSLDIVIVNYNSTDYLLRCLESLFSSLKSVSAEIYIQDNASEDNIDRLSSAFPEVHLTKNTANLGFAKAVNQALHQCRSPWILLLNPDTYITENFFEPLLEYMTSDPEVGIVGPAIRNADGSLQGSARSFPTLLTAFFGRSSLLSKALPGNRLTGRNLLDITSDGVTPLPVDWVSGACMLIRRKALDETGFLDERFFMYWEDADLCRQAWMKGWKVAYFPRSTLIHYAGISSRRQKMRSIFELHRSSCLFYSKYISPFRSLFIPLVFTGLSLRCLVVWLATLMQQGRNGPPI